MVEVICNRHEDKKLWEEFGRKMGDIFWDKNQFYKRMPPLISVSFKNDLHRAHSDSDVQN